MPSFNQPAVAVERQKAQVSLRSCSTWCIMVLLANLIFRIATSKKDFTLLTTPESQVKWKDIVEVLDNAYLLLMGLGLWRVSSLYGSSTVSFNNLYDVCWAMTQMWTVTAVAIVGVALSKAFTLRDDETEEFNPQFLLVGITVLLIGMPLVRVLNHKYTKKIIQELQNSNKSRSKKKWKAKSRGRSVAEAETKGETDDIEPKPLKPDAARARNMGLTTSSRLAQCAAAFTFLGFVEMVIWFVSFEDSWLNWLSAIAEFGKTFMMAAILINLYRRELSALVDITATGSHHQQLYIKYYESQNEVFSKASGTFRGSVWSRLSPVILNPVMPHWENFLGSPFVTKWMTHIQDWVSEHQRTKFIFNKAKELYDVFGVAQEGLVNWRSVVRKFVV